MARNDDDEPLTWEEAFWQDHRHSAGVEATKAFLQGVYIDFMEEAVTMAEKIAASIKNAKQRKTIQNAIERAIDRSAERAYLQGAFHAHKAERQRVAAASKARAETASRKGVEIRKVYASLRKLEQADRLEATARRCKVSARTVRRHIG